MKSYRFYLHESDQESLSFWAVMPSNPPFQAHRFPLVLSSTLSGLLLHFLYRTWTCVCPKVQRSETACYNHDSWTLRSAPSPKVVRFHSGRYLTWRFQFFQLLRICLLVTVTMSVRLNKGRWQRSRYSTRAQLQHTPLSITLVPPLVHTEADFILWLTFVPIHYANNLGRKPNGRHIWQIGAKYLLQFLLHPPPLQAVEVSFCFALYR